ncbi:MAG: S9 family peptidase [Pseudomonadota bacterium]
MTLKYWILTLLAPLLIACGNVGNDAQSTREVDPKEANNTKDPSAYLTIDRVFQEKEFDIETPIQKKWVDAGMGYTTIENSVSVKGAKDIVRYDTATGKRSILVDATRLVPSGNEPPLELESYAWSDDGQYLLIQTNAVKFRRHKSLGDFWVLAVETNKLRQIGTFADPSSLLYAAFSPDSQSVAYVHKHNIYVEPIMDGTPTQLTQDGSDLIVNGMADWVNEEEFPLRSGYRWSPDSKRIAFWRFDTNGVGTFYMMNNTDGVYSKPVPLQYPKAGTTNSAVEIGVVDVTNQQTVWIDLPGDLRQNYVPYMEWADSSEELFIQRMNRKQNTNQVLLGNASSGETQRVYVDQDEAWVDVNTDVKWLQDGTNFTWLSEKSGWRKLYRVSRDGKEETLLTPGAFDVLSVIEIDVDAGWAYFIASPEDPAARYLYRSPLFGEARVERLTPTDKPGTHVYDIAPTAGFAFHTVSSVGVPPKTNLISLPDHETVRVMVENTKVAQRIDTLARGDFEFFDVEIDDSVVLDGWMMKPPGFDPSKKYPLLIYVYGEPAGQTVLNRWGRSGSRSDRYLWHLMMSQKGYIVASIDNRGTPAPKGRDWRKSIYGQIGILASADQAKAIKKLLDERPYLDPDRVGSWGWSGGGQMTLNALFRYPEVYKTGVAVSFVSDQRLYDTIYQERFMGLPSENEEGYRLGSPITFAEQLAGDLLIVHGTADDNVHYQNTEQLIKTLIEHDKDFSLTIYPDNAHALDDTPNSKRHLYRTMQNFILDKLPPGGRNPAK